MLRSDRHKTEKKVSTCDIMTLSVSGLVSRVSAWQDNLPLTSDLTEFLLLGVTESCITQGRDEFIRRYACLTTGNHENVNIYKPFLHTELLPIAFLILMFQHLSRPTEKIKQKY